MEKQKKQRKDTKCQCCNQEFTPDEFYYDFCRECSYKWEYEDDKNTTRIII